MRGKECASLTKASKNLQGIASVFVRTSIIELHRLSCAKKFVGRWLYRALCGTTSALSCTPELLPAPPLPASKSVATQANPNELSRPAVDWSHRNGDTVLPKGVVMRSLSLTHLTKAASSTDFETSSSTVSNRPRRRWRCRQSRLAGLSSATSARKCAAPTFFAPLHRRQSHYRRDIRGTVSAKETDNT